MPPAPPSLVSHAWQLTPTAAVALQRQLAPLVEREDRLPPLQRVAGIDVGFEAAGSIARAAVAVLSFPDLQPMEQAVARLPVSFPYIPGLLSFREAPAVLAALEQLDAAPAPDLLMVDGQGLAHPRRFGLACHLGIITGLAAVGVGKTRLLGQFDTPGPNKGDSAPLIHQGEVIGQVLRTRQGCHPLFISLGHRVSLATAVSLTLACTPRFRLPETTRQAHRLASG